MYISFIRPKYFIYFFVAFDGFILMLHHFFSQDVLLGDFFDLDKEANLPTWYSSCKFILAAVAAFLCYQSEKNAKKMYRFSWGWWGIILLMLGMSMDETGQLHEVIAHSIMSGKSGENIRVAFGVSDLSDTLLWGVLFSPFLLILGISCMLFYIFRFKQHRFLILASVGVIVLLGGALCLETFEAKLLGSEGFLSKSQWDQYRLYITVEEFAEMFSASLLVVIHYAYAFHNQPSSRYGH